MARSNFIATHLSHQARQQPNKTAFIQGGEAVTYEVLHSSALRIAAFIRDNYPGCRDVLVWDDGSIAAHLAAVGVLYAGCCYVPLHHGLPSTQLASIIEQTDARLCLGGSAKNEPVVQHEALHYQDVNQISTTNTYLSDELEHPYLLFTSGSTGAPKGIRISNANLSHFFQFFRADEETGLSSEDRFLQAFDLSFDVSVFTFLLPLTLGGTVILYEPGDLKYANVLKAIQQHQPTVVTLVPAFADYLAPYGDRIKLPSIRLTIFTADQLLGRHVNSWQSMAPKSAIHNLYGPTETTIFTSRYMVENYNFPHEAPIPIGQPIGEQSFQASEAGELLIAGPQVFDGYLDPALNKEVFTTDGAYRSGDLAAEDGDGNYHFLGRLDDQVKVDGYRIELEEINQVLRKLTGKRVVTFMREKDEWKYLAAAIESSSIDKHQLRQELLTVLPKYKIPRELIAIAKFPLNRNGKIDRKNLIASIKHGN